MCALHCSWDTSKKTGQELNKTPWIYEGLLQWGRSSALWEGYLWLSPTPQSLLTLYTLSSQLRQQSVQLPLGTGPSNVVITQQLTIFFLLSTSVPFSWGTQTVLTCWVGHKLGVAVLFWVVSVRWLHTYAFVRCDVCGWCSWWYMLCCLWFMLVFTSPSNHVKFDVIAKNMITIAHSQKIDQKSQCDIYQVK